MFSRDIRISRALTRALIFLALLCAACGRPAYAPKTPVIADASGATNAMGRAEPGYIQWLERQSMTYQATNLLRVVSGSHLQWRVSGIAPHPETLFRHADVWLAVHPLAVLTESDNPVFKQLSGPEFWRPLHKAGIRGLFISPSGPSGALWRGSLANFSNGLDEVGFSFSDAAGKDEDYKALVAAANRNGCIAGLRMIASATGIGPDFFLAARGLRQYPGIYSMVEVPRELWPLLPRTEKEWRPAPLDRAQIAALARAGMFAPALVQDSMGLPGGWAATHEVRGLDGNARRFVFRWFGRPWEPVFNWADPSRAAQRIVSAGIIRGVGELGSALAGFRLKPYLGLTPETGAALSLEEAAQPALEAGNAMAQETRRYGGWSLVTDALPMELLPALWAEGPDFALDCVFSPASEHALLTGNARLLRASIDAALALGIDARRLAHVMPGTEGVDYSAAELNGRLSASLPPQLRAAFSPALVKAETARVPAGAALFRNGRLYATTPAIAAMALGCRNMEDLKPDVVEKITKAHRSMICFKAMQPGLLMLTAYDLSGAMPLTWNMPDKTGVPSEYGETNAGGLNAAGATYAEGTDPGNAANEWEMPGIDSGAPEIFGATGLTASASRADVSYQGVARAPTVHSPLDVQGFDPRSLLSGIAPALAARAELRVAEGRLAARLKAVGPGVAALAVELPDKGGLLISIVNFGLTPRTENLNLNRDLEAAGITLPGRAAKDLFGNGTVNIGGGFLNVTLEAWGYRAFVVKNRSGNAHAD